MECCYMHHCNGEELTSSPLLAAVDSATDGRNGRTFMWLQKKKLGTTRNRTMIRFHNDVLVLRDTIADIHQ